MADRIVLKGMTFYGYHGATPHERERGQPFVVDVEMELDLSGPVSSDDLRDTVDYSTVFRVAREVVEGPARNLLESVADGLASAAPAETSRSTPSRSAWPSRRCPSATLCSNTRPWKFTGAAAKNLVAGLRLPNRPKMLSATTCTPLVSRVLSSARVGWSFELASHLAGRPL